LLINSPPVSSLRFPRLNCLQSKTPLLIFGPQDGKPYILSLAAGQALEDQRSQGYTLVAKSEFSSLDDMKYYDNECEAHKTLKIGAKSLGVEGVMTVYYPPEVLATL
jgi:hypothetical protein